MYAFAIWDAIRGGLLLARDPFGIKPLYYADDGKSIRVASQVKALCAGGRTGCGVAPAGVVGFFLWGYVPDPHTLYADIHALPAGSCMWIDRHGAGAPRPFFTVREALAAAEDEADQLTPDEQKAQLDAALRDTVAHHLVADVPVGVFLSAGLDSTTLTALAAAQHGGGLRTLTLGFEEYRGTAADEVPLAEATAVACATDHQTRWVRDRAFQSDLPALLQAMDQPTTDGVNTYLVSKAAAEAGLKVALSGIGGDELFGSYGSYRQIPRLVQALAPIRTWPGFGRQFRRVAAPVLKRFTSPKYASLFEYGTSVADAYLLRRGLFMPWELPHLLDSELIRQGWAELDPQLRLQQEIKGLRHSFSQVAALELGWYMRSQLLRDADWAGMAHSLEIRVPLVDNKLFHTVLPMVTGPRPPSKRDMALTPTLSLPPEVLNRPKSGFHVPVAAWLRRDPTTDAAPVRGLRNWARYVFGALTPAAVS
jgi:asparagine synthase (glutamine-hydrolysing)